MRAHPHVCIHTHVRMHTHPYKRARMHMHTHIQARTHAHAHTCAFMRVPPAAMCFAERSIDNVCQTLARCNADGVDHCEGAANAGRGTLANVHGHGCRSDANTQAHNYSSERKYRPSICQCQDGGTCNENQRPNNDGRLTPEAG